MGTKEASCSVVLSRIVTNQVARDSRDLMAIWSTSSGVYSMVIFVYVLPAVSRCEKISTHGEKKGERIF